jgi:hypothetical protein
VKGVLVNHFKEIAIVSVVDMRANKDRPGHRESLLQEVTVLKNDPCGDVTGIYAFHQSSGCGDLKQRMGGCRKMLRQSRRNDPRSAFPSPCDLCIQR